MIAKVAIAGVGAALLLGAAAVAQTTTPDGASPASAGMNSGVSGSTAGTSTPTGTPEAPATTTTQSTTAATPDASMGSSNGSMNTTSTTTSATSTSAGQYGSNAAAQTGGAATDQPAPAAAAGERG